MTLSPAVSHADRASVAGPTHIYISHALFSPATVGLVAAGLMLALHTGSAAVLWGVLTLASLGIALLVRSPGFRLSVDEDRCQRAHLRRLARYERVLAGSRADLHELADAVVGIERNMPALARRLEVDQL